jgi:RNA recognition motif-containing protein
VAFGEVGSVKIIIDHNILKSRGFAFVEMERRDQWQRACRSNSEGE